MRIAVTTSRDEEMTESRAQRIARELDVPWIPRRGRSLDSIRAEHMLDYLLVVEREQVVLKGATILNWHPSMAVPRIKALREGKKDPMVEAMALREGNSVLDCTLGLGSDALVAAYAAGDGGSVTGLEASKYLAFITRWGLRHFGGQNKHLRKATDRLKVINVDFREFLKQQAAGSFDVVYFDPMFRHGRKKSSSINALRPLAKHDPLNEEDIREALRVAKCRVVVKESAKSGEFARLKAHFVSGGRYSPVAYGVWEKS
ncbi:MAG: class I SAM-dependent methyltransferase [Peptococcaceae bacterium]|jgi:SAM-dependent methyltransferase|nr:class I SAM-dependent methyltransferase [Peptococcaceae bacterium]MDH7524138.1 class I SAM-dependent methyltransferase [Peptococcaceae bacterium]